MRYHVLLPFTGLPSSSESTLTCSPPANCPTTGAFVLGPARTLAGLARPHQPAVASSAEGSVHCCAAGFVVASMECSAMNPSVVAHHRLVSPSMPGETPVTRSKSPCLAVRRTPDRGLDRAYMLAEATETSAVHGTNCSVMSLEGTQPSGVS